MKPLEGLNDAQQEAAKAAGPVLALAGAGTGKTTMMVGRVAHLVSQGASPSRILCVTFTNKAGAELRQRVEVKLRGEGRRDPFAPKLDITAGTFHAISLKLLREQPHLAGLEDGFTIADEDDAAKIVRDLLTLCPEILEDILEDNPRKAARGLAATIAKFKEAGWRPAEASRAVTEEDGAWRNAAARLYPDYQARLRQENKADFADLLLWTVLAAESDEAVRAAWAARWDHHLVDEYQDTNAIQHRWLKCLAGDGHNLCAVGDDDQAIYTFAGAEVGFILEFEQNFPGATVIKLQTNYRSSANILRAANAVIRENVERRDKHLIAHADDGDPVVLRMASSAHAEARWIAARTETICAAETQDARPAGVFVLYRANWQSRLIEEGMIDRGVDYCLKGDQGFYGREEVLDALSYLALAAGVAGDEAPSLFERVGNKPARGLGPKAREAILAEAARRDGNILAAGAALRDSFNKPGREGWDAFAAALARAAETLEAYGPDACLEDILTRAGYYRFWEESEHPKAEEKRKNLEELVSALEGFVWKRVSKSENHEHRDTVRAFLERAARAREQVKTDARVSLMTLHASKGLEEDYVFLAGWDEGRFPSAKALEREKEGDSRAIEDERRLAYVGLTRCRRSLTITHLGEANRFARDIPADIVDLSPRRAPADRPMVTSTDSGQEAGEDKAVDVVSVEEGHRQIAADILAAIESGDADGWDMPWAAVAERPTNPLSGHVYAGRNIVALWAGARRFGYGSHFWAPSSMWEKAGGNVIDPDCSVRVLKPVFHDHKKRRLTAKDTVLGGDPADPTGQQVIGFKPGMVFNRENVEGEDLPEPAAPLDVSAWAVNPVEQALSAYLRASGRKARAGARARPKGPALRHGGMMAAYTPKTDVIVMPPKSAFRPMPSPSEEIPPAAAYLSVLAHECAHSTGSRNRLARKFSSDKASPSYAREELVAELTAAFIMSHFGAGAVPRDDHAAYIAHYLAILKNDPQAFAAAVGQADRATRYVLDASNEVSSR